MIDLATIPLPKCSGTRSTYVRGCSCVRCSEANNTYMRDYRARQKVRT